LRTIAFLTVADSFLPNPEHWAYTVPAAQRLGLSAHTLKRYARAELFVFGEHYRPGVYRNSPWIWNLPACAERMLQLSKDNV